MVSATVGHNFVMTIMPRRLQPAAIKIAARGEIERVETQVAIALGASVPPLTSIAAKISTTDMRNGGLLTSCCRKVENVIIIADRFLLAEVRD